MTVIRDVNGTWNYPPWFFSMNRFNPGGPTWYGKTQRLPAELYLRRSVMGVIAAALTFLLVLIVVLPIIKHRIQSVIAALNSIAIGVAISLCLVCPEWIRGHSIIQSPIYYHSPKAYVMTLGVHIGLSGFNVTLRTVDRNFDVLLDGGLQAISKNQTSAPEIYYNEHVEMYHPESMEGALTNALERGLPVPLLVAYDCLSSAVEGFQWSHRIVEAGYHCYILTVFALAGWFLNQVLIAAIPRYSAYGFVIIGYLMVFDALLYTYWANISLSPPCIVITDSYVELRHGMCFWTCLGMGVWSCIYGLIMSVYDTVYPDKFLTAFDLDYDHKRALAAANHLDRISAANITFHRHSKMGQQSDPFVKAA